MRTVFSLLLVFAFVAGAQAQEAIKVVKHLQEVSVTVKTNSHSGSGVFITRGDQQFVWTAGHVVAELRSTREMITPDGTKRTIVEFADAQVVKINLYDGRIVSSQEFDAQVIKFSDSEAGRDLALLRLRQHDAIKGVNAEFWLGKEPPPVGTDLIHVGSLRGQLGANSTTTGIMSQHGRVLNGIVYDQVTTTAFPGSSGGGVFTREGLYVGMLVRGAGETFCFVVPAREIVKWAKENKLEWAVNTKIAMPTADEIDKLPIEDPARQANRGYSIKGSVNIHKFLFDNKEEELNIMPPVDPNQQE